jgi:hypothetical protein
VLRIDSCSTNHFPLRRGEDGLAPGISRLIEIRKGWPAPAELRSNARNPSVLHKNHFIKARSSFHWGIGLDAKKGRVLKFVVPAVGALIVAVVLVAVYLSPALSWSSSVRDSDGDGVVDSKDAFPNDSERSLPEVSLVISAANHNWTLTVDGIWAEAGKKVAGIPSGDVRVEATGSSGGSRLVTALSALPQDSSASGVRYVDATNQGSLDEGDAFVLALSDYRPGSLFNLTSTKVGEPYTSLVLEKATPSGTGGQNWTSDSFRWTFSSLTPRVSWNDVEIHISDGSNEASWAPSVEDDGNASLPNADLGPRSLAFTLRSETPNGMIDPGDNFTISSSPGFDPNRTYSVSVSYDFGGEISRCSFSLSGPPMQIPTLDLDLVTLLSDSAWVQFSSVEGTLAWDDIIISLYGDYVTLFWLVNESELSTGGYATTYCGASILDGMTISCGAEDLVGNGLVDSSDAIALAADPGFLDVTDYVVTVIYKPSWEAMATLSFAGQPVTPVSSLTKSSIANGVKLTFAPFSQDTQWSDVTILLSDGTNTVTWSPLTADLAGASTMTKAYGIRTLGALSVYCNVTDLAGNGYINQGDYFTLKVDSSQSWSSATAYTVTIMHDPTAAEICHLSFNG